MQAVSSVEEAATTTTEGAHASISLSLPENTIVNTRSINTEIGTNEHSIYCAYLYQVSLLTST